MFSVDGQDSWNFFGNDWSNHIPVPQSKALAPLAIKFHTATDYIQAGSLVLALCHQVHGRVLGCLESLVIGSGHVISSGHVVSSGHVDVNELSVKDNDIFPEDVNPAFEKVSDCAAVNEY